MDIRGIIAPPSPSSALPARPVTEPLRVPAENKPVEPVRETQHDGTTRTDGKKPAPLTSGARLELDIDQSTQQVYAKVVDPNTGTLLRELPSEHLRALHAFAIKSFRPIVDTKA
jgi:hypothetical protein